LVAARWRWCRRRCPAGAGHRPALGLPQVGLGYKRSWSNLSPLLSYCQKYPTRHVSKRLTVMGPVGRTPPLQAVAASGNTDGSMVIVVSLTVTSLNLLCPVPRTKASFRLEQMSPAWGPVTATSVAQVVTLELPPGLASARAQIV